LTESPKALLERLDPTLRRVAQRLAAAVGRPGLAPDLHQEGLLGLWAFLEERPNGQVLPGDAQAVGIARNAMRRLVRSEASPASVPDATAKRANRAARAIHADGLSEADACRLAEIDPGTYRDVRAAQGHVPLDAPAVLDVEDLDPAPSPEAEASRRSVAVARLLAAALERIPSEYADVVRLTFGLGQSGRMTNPEAAEMLGVSEATVKRRKARGVELLREAVEYVRAHPEPEPTTEDFVAQAMADLLTERASAWDSELLELLASEGDPIGTV
jgi:RNA polymerase sigma factor (sigma-70 family)